MKEAVASKKRAFEEWLQKRDGVTYDRYRGERSVVKRVVKEAKKRADARWGMRLSENFGENRRMFWREVKRVRKKG